MVLGLTCAALAYATNPAVPLLATAVLGAVVLGLWRLEYGIALVLIAAPFAENMSITDPGSAKLRLALVLWAPMLVVVEIARTALASRRLQLPAMSWGALAFVVAALLAVPTASDGLPSAAKALLLIGSVAIAALVGLFIREWRTLRIVLVAALASGLLISFHAIFQYLTGDLSRVGFISVGGEVEYRVASVFPHPNQLAGFLVVFVPLALALRSAFSEPWLRAACALLVAAAAFGVLVTYSRGALVALAALPLLYLSRPRAWPLIAGAAVAVVLLAPGALGDRVANAGQLDRPEIASRVDFWDAALTMFGQRPILGIGLDNFGSSYIELEQPGRSFVGGGSLAPPETAHSLYLNTLAEQGLIGAMALAILAISLMSTSSSLRKSEDVRARAMGQALAGMGLVLLVHNAFDVTLTDPKTSTLVWALLGAGAAMHRIDMDRGPAQEP